MFKIFKRYNLDRENNLSVRANFLDQTKGIEFRAEFLSAVSASVRVRLRVRVWERIRIRRVGVR